MFKGLLEKLGDIEFICEIWWHNRAKTPGGIRIFYQTSDRIFQQNNDNDATEICGDHWSVGGHRWLFRCGRNPSDDELVLWNVLNNKESGEDCVVFIKYWSGEGGPQIEAMYKSKTPIGGIEFRTNSHPEGEANRECKYLILVY